MAKLTKRTLLQPHPGDKRYIRRIAKGQLGAGQIKTSVNVGRSLTDDRRKHAKKIVKPGQGDRGDQKNKGKRK